MIINKMVGYCKPRGLPGFWRYFAYATLAVGTLAIPGCKHDTYDAKKSTEGCATLVTERKKDEAVKCLEQVLKSKPDFHLAWLYKGNVLADQNKFDEAQRCLRYGSHAKP